MEGAPESVEGYFNCKNNKLISLKGGPKKVNWNYNCSYNQLTTLEGAPTSVSGIFTCDNNPGKHLKEEYQIRKNNPDLSEFEIKIELAIRGFILDDDMKYLKDIFFL